MRSVFLMSDKEIFDVHSLPAAQFAKSMGLPNTPRIKFTKVFYFIFIWIFLKISLKKNILVTLLLKIGTKER